MAQLARSMRDVVRQLDEGIGISHSQIELRNRCQRRWAYEKILKLDPGEDSQALVYGSAGHTALEHIGRGDYLQNAIHAGLSELAKEGAGQKWLQQCLDRLPLHIQGFCAHYLPTFLQKWEIVEVEPSLDYFVCNGVKWRGFIDLVARNRQTGAIGIFDYKFSGKQYISTLSYGLEYSHQLANYTMAYMRKTGEWPGRVGYIFLSKPQGGEDLNNLLTDPSKYIDKCIDVDTRFAQFAMSVEQNDAHIGLDMRRWFELYTREGVAALDRVPSNFGSCFQYGSKCGFCAGCHSGKPVHALLKDQP